MNQFDIEALKGRTVVLNGQDMGVVVGGYLETEFSFLSGHPTKMKMVLLIEGKGRIHKRDAEGLSILPK